MNILIEAFADAKFWRKRQIFVNLCYKLVSFVFFRRRQISNKLTNLTSVM